jgi:3,4-dihydroxy 2-butanone 4-phosphate synthase/GTP cyclohydrolase II
MPSIPDILDDLKAGRVVVLTDDEDRENEGDLICAAEHCSPDIINFMLTEGRGMLFVAADGATCDRLDLPPQAAVNTTQRGTAYTISIDAAARHGVTTGVSANDRSLTIRKLADPDATPADFDRPGHIQPLRSREGGVLVRTGHTEGIVDLCRLAGLQPVGFGIEIMNPDGSMARRDQIEAICEKHGLKRCSVADLIEYRMQQDLLVQRIDTIPFRNELGDWTLIAYRSLVDPFPHVALVCGEVGRQDARGQAVDVPGAVLVRMHSQNLLGDVFGDLQQPSHDILVNAMRRIQQAGQGAVVYLRHEGMGRGLLKRLQTAAPVGGADPAASNETPKFGQRDATAGATAHRNAMDYGIGSQVLRDLGIRKLKLITDHPFTPNALAGFGLEITQFVSTAS